MNRTILSAIGARLLLVAAISMVAMGLSADPAVTESRGHVVLDSDRMQVIWMLSDGTCEYIQGNTVWTVYGCFIPDL